MKKDVYELTSPQKNIWQIEQINEKDSSINHILAILKLNSVLDEPLLIKSVKKLIEVNTSFNFKFKVNKNSICQYIDNTAEHSIEVKHVKTEDISSIVNKYKKFPISLENTFAFCIVFTPSKTYVLYKTHHIINDGWGVTQTADQLKEIYDKYQNQDDLDNFKKTSYLDFINREKIYLDSEKFKSDESFWNEYVKNIDPSHLFKNTMLLNKKANRLEQDIDINLSHSISDFCKNNKITEYAFFLGILSIYFSKIYSLNNIIFGTPFLNRQKRFKELESLGMYVSTLPLNVSISNDETFISLCKNISSTNMSLYKHSNFPYHKIQELYSNEKSINTNLYEIGFSYQINQLSYKMSNGDVGSCSWVFSEEQNNPLTIHLTSLNQDNNVISYDYLQSCFNDDEIEKMNKIILHIISQILSGCNFISDISILIDEDKKKIEKFNATGNVNQTQENIINIFEDIVKKYSEKVAVKYNDISITYSELDIKSSILAKNLINLGVKKNTPVALFFDKSIDMIISILGVLKSGGCYVPILPDENSSRIDYIIKDCNPKCILTHKNYNKKIIANMPIISIDTLDLTSNVSINFSNVSFENIAYIIYTSGSTGNPKGTMVTHQNICNLKYSIENDKVLKASNRDISISLLKYSFDASGIDIYTSLLFGGKLILVSKEDELNPEKVVNLMEKEKVTRSFLIPKWLEHISIQDKLLNTNLENLKILGTGGETLKPYIIENLLTKYPKLKILNLYGPTETTMFTTYKQVSLEDVEKNYTSIGKPIYGSRIAITNSNGVFMPIDTKGELVIYEDENSIKNISNGYINLPEQTNNKFVNIYNPIIKKYVKAYKTGDIAKINKNLEIDFMGRNDDIVKVNGGYLVALNEVENNIQSILGNNFEIKTISIPYKNTNAIIVFFTTTERNISINNIKNYINANISFYMKPKKIIQLKSFPRNSSGKINRTELKDIAIKSMEENKNKFIAPKTLIELDIYNYLKELTNIDDISTSDDFLDDLGIDSLALTALYSYLEKYNINIQDLYNNSNIHDLANLIETQASNSMQPNLSNIEDLQIINNIQNVDFSTVLITGVTGFLGAHLFKDLLINDNVKEIYCIIRNKINLNGKKRLLQIIDYYFNSDNYLLDLIKKKVSVLDGDITKSRLGLEEDVYKKLKKEVTLVINSAANVRHFVKPSQIRRDNVQSVKNLITFCGNRITLTHISTLSIAGFHSDLTYNKIFDENTLFINQDFNNNPYLISKFEAEKYILESINTKKLNAIIFRLGNIMPRQKDGVFQINANTNVFLSALKAIIDSKVIAQDLLNLKLEFSPVDECSNIILKLLENKPSNAIYHILSDKEITISEIKTLLKFLKYDIVDVDLKTFITEISKTANTYAKEYILSNSINKYSQDITLNKMRELGLEWKNVDIAYMKKILNILKKI